MECPWTKLVAFEEGGHLVLSANCRCPDRHLPEEFQTSLHSVRFVFHALYYPADGGRAVVPEGNRKDHPWFRLLDDDTPRGFLNLRDLVRVCIAHGANIPSSRELGIPSRCMIYNWRRRWSVEENTALAWERDAAGYWAAERYAWGAPEEDWVYEPHELEWDLVNDPSVSAW